MYLLLRGPFDAAASRRCGPGAPAPGPHLRDIALDPLPYYYYLTWEPCAYVKYRTRESNYIETKTRPPENLAADRGCMFKDRHENAEFAYTFDKLTPVTKIVSVKPNWS